MTAVLNRYKLMAGQHYGVNPDAPPGARFLDRMKLYTAGDIVESEEELDKKHLNKFELQNESTPRVIVSEMRKARVTELITTGIWAETDRDWLEQLTDDRFMKVTGSKELQPEPDKRIQSALGKDITDTFQVAYDSGFKVFKNPSGLHQVTKSPDHSKPLNRNPLKAEDVNKWVENYLKEK